MTPAKVIEDFENFRKKLFSLIAECCYNPIPDQVLYFLYPAANENYNFSVLDIHDFVVKVNPCRVYTEGEILEKIIERRFELNFIDQQPFCITKKHLFIAIYFCVGEKSIPDTFNMHCAIAMPRPKSVDDSFYDTIPRPKFDINCCLSIRQNRYLLHKIMCSWFWLWCRIHTKLRSV